MFLRKKYLVSVAYFVYNDVVQDRKKKADYVKQMKNESY